MMRSTPFLVFGQLSTIGKFSSYHPVKYAAVAEILGENGSKAGYVALTVVT